ncbi:hypothetical protein EZS27_016738 [termite gut metagenome]|uniref:GmrSD restriction endonucleases N-terminal domain-containing protein n=1 Tax=termite gut metagenome TaxID=433724 RepID=A0A5J4RMT7_9ZZZZ
MAESFKSIEDNIEPEEGNENVKNEIPFNPNDISINIVPRTIGQIVDMLRYGEILIPSYQRLPNLWNEKKKSRFIESLMLSLPIPLFYFDESEDKKWRVIDGLQRISTLEHFIILDDKEEQQTKTISGNKQPLILQNLEFKIELNGKKWSELPRDVQRRIETNQVTINLIGKGTPDEVKYNIFSRINQGGEELTAQEIRTALFQGYRVDFIEMFVSDKTDAGNFFLKATDNSISSKRQDDLDFATRFLSFYLLDYEEYEPDMDSFLTTGTKSIPKELELREKILTNFQKAMSISYEIFGTNSFRKITSDNQRNRINKPLFEIMSVYFAKLNEKEKTILLQKKEICKNDFIQKLQSNRTFWSSITTGTATKDSVRKRHELFKEFLSKFIL